MNQRECVVCGNITTQNVCERCGNSVYHQNGPHQLPVGTVLRDQYRVGRVLGQGGFGITYLGWDTYLETPVAIKEYYPSTLVTRDSRRGNIVYCNTEQAHAACKHGMDRFAREARALARFESVPAIVHVKSVFPENSTAYIVMEYVSGRSLQKYVADRGGRLSLEETLTILKPVMEALTQIHRENVVHRDISPDNIIYDKTRGAKLIDFGSVRAVQETSCGSGNMNATEAIVKHGFAPMEQYGDGEKLGVWSDVYALCATIYYCVTGQVPPDAYTRFSGDAGPDWGGIPGITPAQVKALEKGFALKHENRTGSVEELMRELYRPPVPGGDSAVSHGTTGLNNLGCGDNNITVVVDQHGIDNRDQDRRNLDKEAQEKLRLQQLHEAELWQKQLQEERRKKWRELLGKFTGKVDNSEGSSGETDTKKGVARGVIALVTVILAIVCYSQVHIWQEPTCTKDGNCIICGRVNEEKLGHSWKAASCTDPKTCMTCGTTQGSALGHNWLAATCTESKVCLRCGKKEGSNLPHVWTPATYYQPETCTRCHMTRGTVKGYISEMGGSWDTFYSGGYYSSSYVFERKLDQCRGFTIDVWAETMSGTVDGYWKVFYKTGKNVWVEVEGFMMENGKGTATYTFDPTVEVSAVAVLLSNGSGASYNFSLLVRDLYCFD